MKTESIPAASPLAIPRALDLLNAGELVALPTDTVYGLAARLAEPKAIEALYNAKGREAAKAIAVLLSRVDDLPRVTARMTPAAEKLARRFWPGPLTLVVPRHPDLPENISPLPTIGVRMPDHPIALALLNASGPLAVTSANLSGQENTCTAQEVLCQLEGRIALVIDGGKTPGGTPSTVVDCTSEQITVLRPGPITLAELLAVL